MDLAARNRNTDVVEQLKKVGVMGVGETLLSKMRSYKIPARGGLGAG
jgi:hypothetical protein